MRHHAEDRQPSRNPRREASWCADGNGRGIRRPICQGRRAAIGRVANGAAFSRTGDGDLKRRRVEAAVVSTTGSATSPRSATRFCAPGVGTVMYPASPRVSSVFSSRSRTRKSGLWRSR